MVSLFVLVVGTVGFCVWYSFDNARSRARHRHATERADAARSTGVHTASSPEQNAATEAAMLDDASNQMYRQAQASGQLGFRPFSPGRAIGTALFFGNAAHGLYEVFHDDHDPQHGFHPVDLDNLS